MHAVFTDQLTPQSRVLSEKLMGPQLVEKFPTFCRTWRFITSFTKACYLFISWARSVFCEWFITWWSFCGEGLLASCPTPKLEYHFLSAACDLFIQYICSCSPYLEAVSPPATWGHTMPLWLRNWKLVGVASSGIVFILVFVKSNNVVQKGNGRTEATW